MRAVRVNRTDGPESVVLEEVPEPEPAEGDVVIDIEAAGVNFPDLLLTQDKYQYKPELPFILGGELAGTVRQAPQGSEYAPGDRVAAISTTGAFAEVVTVPAHDVFPLPERVSFAAGACLPMNYLTMTFALLTRGQLQKGETVLVHGAAGGIGTATVQLALAMGARVISVVSTPEKAEFVTSIGSYEVVLAEGFKDAVQELTGGAGVDMVVDPVGGDRFTDSLRSLAPLGRLLVIGFTGGDIPTVKVNRLLLNNIDVRGVGWGAYAIPRPGYQRKVWDTLYPYLESGAVDPPIGGTVPLARAGEAVAGLGKRAVLGKFVVDVRAER
ncbi:NADPH:quinone oxidoreductase family protein [Amycolatopsis sp. K13G38]|uniref:NADPH:quinone oxidoreductase family protein n=1 Tax=Amycolatopsis acididurans TaxID=2724524 RepID=A0ABX1J091_9PSEU|nr:NADPH:quinone oxidoreductase family protein [Amycolatopsis acididurans]NKQ53190.1 NADPH:quinone oxidoreductase family protein [Amycolatopsis acididurans]